MTLQDIVKWSFTAAEHTILNNVPPQFRFLARDAKGNLRLFEEEPVKGDVVWYSPKETITFGVFNHLFKSVEYEDKKACEFKKI